MNPLYSSDLAYIHAVGFGDLARGAAPEILRRLKNPPIAIRRVVDVGCGAGLLTAALCAAGFEVTGIDSSPELLERARGAAGAEFICGSVYETRIPPCEAIVAVGEPLAYHPDGATADQRLEAFFGTASRVLPPGGILIFDAIEQGEPSLAGRFWRAGEDWAVMVETEEHRDARTLVRNIQTFRRVDGLYRRGSEVHRVSVFDTATLLRQLAACGFSTDTAQSYGEQRLGIRRRAFFCTRNQA